MRTIHPSITQRLMGNTQNKNELEKDANKQHSLNLAEYILLSGSVAGSILAITSQQVAYATVPLTLALSLNVFNRSQFQRQIRLHTSNNVADVCQVVQSLHQQVQALPAEPVSLDSIKQSLEPLEQKTQTLTQQFNARPETQAIAKLTNQLDTLALRLDNLSNPSEPVDLSGIEAEIATLQAQLQAIDLSSVTSSVAQLQTDLQTQIDQLLQQLQDLPFSPSALEQRLIELERKNHSIFSDDVGSLGSEVKHLQSDKAFIQKVLAHLTNQLDSLAQQFYTRPETQLFAHLTKQLDALAQQFYARPETQLFAQRTKQLDALAHEVSTQPETQLFAHLDHLPSSLESVDFSGIEAEIATLQAQLQVIDPSSITSSIAQFQNQIDQLSQQIQNLPLPFDPSPLEQRISQQENSYQTIVAEHNRLVQLVETNMATVQQSIASVQNSAAAALVEAHQHFSQEIESLSTEICALPSPNVLVDLSEIEAEISTLKLKSQVQIIDLCSVTSSVNQLQNTLQSQIDQLLQQIQDLLPSFDTSALEQRLTQLEKSNHSILSDDVSSLVSGELEQLQQVLGQMSKFQQHLKDLDVSTTDVHDYAFKLKHDLEQRIDQLNQGISELDERTQRLSETPGQLEEIKQLTAGLDERTTVVLQKLAKLW